MPRAMLLLAILLRWAMAVGGADEVSAGVDLVGPGAIVDYKEPAQEQTWSVVDTWPAGFFIAGSSISSMNGLYEHSQPDFTLAYQGQLWRNSFTGWSLLDVDAAALGDYTTPYIAVKGEWLLVDDEGRARFGIGAGSYMPPAGELWYHVHGRRKYERLKKGDRVRTREALEPVSTFWEAGETGVIFGVGGKHELPMLWRRDRDGKLFESQGYRLLKEVEVDVAPEGTSTAVDLREGSDDLAELPWQIVGLHHPEEVLRLRNAYMEYMHEVDAVIGIKTGSSHLREEDVSVEEVQLQLSLFHEAMDFLDGSKAPTDDSQSDASRQGKGRGKGRAAQRRGEQCRAASAVWKLEDLLRRNRNFRYTHVQNGETTKVEEWLVRAHARARRCAKSSGAGAAPVVSGIRVGDPVHFIEDLDGFWRKGELAHVIGLGRPRTPIAVKVNNDGRIIDVQEFRIDRVRAFEDEEVSSRTATLDYYELLRLPALFEEHDLHKAYRSASLRLHPDKPGGSKEDFEAAAEANEVLADPKKRRAYDLGEDLPRLQGMTLEEEVMRYYYPDRQGYRAFGDPHDNQERRTETRRLLHREERKRVEESNERRGQRQDL